MEFMYLILLTEITFTKIFCIIIMGHQENIITHIQAYDGNTNMGYDNYWYI